jgi:hypothetical protein
VKVLSTELKVLAVAGLLYIVVSGSSTPSSEKARFIGATSMPSGRATFEPNVTL